MLYWLSSTRPRRDPLLPARLSLYLFSPTASSLFSFSSSFMPQKTACDVFVRLSSGLTEPRVIKATLGQGERLLHRFSVRPPLLFPLSLALYPLGDAQTTLTPSLAVCETLRRLSSPNGAHWHCRRGGSLSALFCSSSFLPTSTFLVTETTSKATNETTSSTRGAFAI